MTEQQQTLRFIKREISSLPPKAQAEVLQIAEQIRELMASKAPYGVMAVALVGAELAAE